MPSPTTTKKVKINPDLDRVAERSAQRSIMSGYSRALEEHAKEKNENDSIADKIFAPKMKYINTILGQHLIHHDFINTYKTFQDDQENGSNPDKRGIRANHHLIKAELFHVSQINDYYGYILPLFTQNIGFSKRRRSEIL